MESQIGPVDKKMVAAFHRPAGQHFALGEFSVRGQPPLNDQGQFAFRSGIRHLDPLEVVDIAWQDVGLVANDHLGGRQQEPQGPGKCAGQRQIGIGAEQTFQRAWLFNRQVDIALGIMDRVEEPLPGGNLDRFRQRGEMDPIKSRLHAGGRDLEWLDKHGAGAKRQEKDETGQVGGAAPVALVRRRGVGGELPVFLENDGGLGGSGGAGGMDIGDHLFDALDLGCIQQIAVAVQQMPQMVFGFAQRMAPAPVLRQQPHIEAVPEKEIEHRNIDDDDQPK